MNERTFERIEEAATQDIGQNALYLNIQNCQLESLPPKVTTMPKLFLLSLRRMPLRYLDLDFHSCESLMYMLFYQLALPAIPESLQHLPSSVKSIVFIEMDIQELPDWISTAWINLGILSFENLKLERFPIQLVSLTNLYLLRLSGNSGITTLPPEIGALENLKTIAMDDCNLKQLPIEITTLVRLKIASFGGNQLESPPWSDKVIRDWHLTKGKILFLQGNPVCDVLGHDVISCSSGCSATCPPTVYSNRICNPGCNSAVCDWDGGDCQI